MTVFLLKKTPGFEQKTSRILLMLFCFFCLLRSVFLLLFPLKTKVDQANKYDVLNFFVFSNELNPGDCKSPPRRGNNTQLFQSSIFTDPDDL